MELLYFPLVRGQSLPGFSLGQCFIIQCHIRDACFPSRIRSHSGNLFRTPFRGKEFSWHGFLPQTKFSHKPASENLHTSPAYVNHCAVAFIHTLVKCEVSFHNQTTGCATLFSNPSMLTLAVLNVNNFPPTGSRPRKRAASTRKKCPLENINTSPFAARARFIIRSALAPTCAGVSPPGQPSRNSCQSGASA